jgi:PBP1b-binding outer membrane lipoprotein LpoB
VASKSLLLIFLLLAGCGNTSQPSVIVQPNTPIAIPPIEPMNLNSVQWQVLTLDQLKKLAEDTNMKQPIFSLDVDNYNNLSLNLIEMQRYIEEQKAILTMLENIIAKRATQTTSTQQP